MKEKKDHATRTAFFLNLAFTVLELAGGILSGSIAILADSLHDLADSFSLGAGWYFEEKSKQGSNDRYSYGYARFSLLGAMINAVTLLLGSIYIVYESIRRLLNPQMPDVYWMLGISVVGIALNGLGVWKLKSGNSMNQQVMMIHLLEDALGWIAVLLASIVLLFVEIPRLDPLLAIVINLTVLVFVLRKLIKALQIMLQRVPKEVNLPELRQKIRCLTGVQDVERLHVWSLTKEKWVVTVTVHLEEMTTLQAAEVLKRRIRQVLADLPIEVLTVELQFSPPSEVSR
ncbi:cobalt-zinc-cadmium efflux system protein [Catalinimonas alkaloidigena]|uniref:Cobalt-zinc-cadmium efflux system protein n=1 Tax=Catalinimonas alkaloidigena TaxID=1075417 RepID=A0A1G9VP13_9BACT|nr:cation diffusion facilitator family transporter [Catalinimonas alkaloidigena]SDM73751.1 cobalt-zinc-cadmium efflux system protein [Catalinimonas alkaloidigena]